VLKYLSNNTCPTLNQTPKVYKTFRVWHWIGLFCALLAAACRPTSGPTDTPTTTATATGTPPPTAAPTSTPTMVPTAPPTPHRVEWVLNTTPNLAQDPSWAALNGVHKSDDRLLFVSEGNYLTVINERGPRIEFKGAWGLQIDLQVLEGEWGAFTLVGRLPQGEWWRNIRRLDLNVSTNAIGATFWDGSKDSPAFSQSFSSPQTDRRVRLGFRYVDGQLFILLNDMPVGELTDPGLFPNQVAYLGVNVPPGGKLALYQINVEREKGRESMVQISGLQIPLVYTPSFPSLRELADRRGLKIGAAVAPGPLRGEPAYAQALAHEYNFLTTENALKFGPVHPQPNTYAFTDADLIVEFAEKHNMQVRGHTLIWHQQLATWVEKGNWTRETLIEVMREHIFTVVGRYKGRIAVWDVVNEAITDSGGALRASVWQQVIGDDYIDLAFQFAHEADPDAQLFYNDYGAEEMNRKSDAVYELVKGMLERGVPIHGVGLQMHIPSTRPPKWASVAENIARLNALGLKVHITELDVRVPDPPNEDKLKRQAEVYRDVLQTCLDAQACTAFITWGFTDRHSWIPGFFSGWGAALPFDETYQPKPAYDALRQALE